MLDEAKKSKGHFVIVEILIFIAVFLAGSIMEILVIGVPYLKYLFGSEEYAAVSKAYYNGEITMEELTDRISVIASNIPAYITLITLFATIAATAVVFIYCRFIEKRKLSTLGFRKKNALTEYIVGALVGAALFSLAVGICLVTGALKYDGVSSIIEWGTLGLFLLGFLFQGMFEEVLVRGYFLVSLQRRVPAAAAIVISSLAFAVLHLANPGMSVLAFVNLFLFGVFAAVYMLKRGNIWGVCAVHSLWNFVQGNFYGIRVSGMGNLTTIFQMTSVESKPLFNGGDFGLEGGLSVTIVLVLATAAMLFTKTKESELAAEREYDEIDAVAAE